MALTAERWRRVSNTVRGVTAGVLLATAPGAFESPKNFGRNLQNPFSVSTAEAGELQSPLEQLAIYNEALQRYSTLLAKKDLAGLEKYSPGDSNFSWKSAGTEPFKYRSKAEFLGLLKQALARSEPKCVGYVQSRRATEYRILFQNLSLGNHPDASGYSYIVLGIVPFENSVSSVLRGVEEVAKKDLEIAKSSVTPCGVETSPIPKPEIPKELARETLVFSVQSRSGNSTIYTANLDGTQMKKFAEKSGRRNDVAWLDGSRILYSEGTEDIMQPWRRIRILDTKTGEKQWLFEDRFYQNNQDDCAIGDKRNGVIFIRRDVSPQQLTFITDVYRYDLVSKETPRSLTERKPKTNECPQVSPDGNYIALYSGGEVVDAAIGRVEVYKNTGFADDYAADRAIAVFEGKRVWGWSPDGKQLLVERRKGRPIVSFSLYSIDLVSGKETKIIETENLSAATYSSDGRWVVFAKSSGGMSSSLYAVEVGKNTPIKLFDSDSLIESLSFKPEVFVPERNTIVLFPGLGSVIKNGKYTGGVFDNLVEIFKYEMGYKDENILLASLGGSTFDSQGRYTPKDQDCTDTLRDQDTNGTAVAQLLRDNTRLHPNDQLTLITHSLGSIGTLRGLEQLLNDNSGFDFSRIKLIITHGPNLGIDKPAWQYLFSPLRDYLPSDCNLDLGLFKLPFPSEINYPALVELKEMWERLPQTTKDRASLTARLTARGAKVYALGSFQDCVMDALACYMPDFLSEIKMLTNPGKFTSLTQELPGAVNIMRHLGHRGIFGHDTFLNTEEGQAIIVTLVGRQLKAGN